MSDPTVEASLRLCSLTSSEPFDWPLSTDALTFCYFFSDLEIETVPRLHDLSDEQLGKPGARAVFVMAIYTGESVAEDNFAWVQERNLSTFVFWTGPLGLQAEVCVKFGVLEAPAFLVLNGDDVLERLRTFPDDLLSLIPTPTDEAPPVLTYAALAQSLKVNHALISSVYNREKAIRHIMGFSSINSVLNSLTEELGLDLSEAVSWFSSQRYGDDPQDVISRDNVTEDQFVRRLINFCLWKSTDFVPAAPQNYDDIWQICGFISQVSSALGKTLGFGSSSSLKSELQASNARVSELSETVSDRDMLIEDLRRELAERNAELADMKRSL